MQATTSLLENCVNDIELKAFMAFMQADDIDDATALLAAIYSTAKQSFRLRVEGLGYTSEDIDRAMQNLERFFMEHPESL